MSEQAKILAEMQELVMSILKNGSASVEEGNKLDELEARLHKQKCFKKTSNPDYDCQGEEIAGLFFKDSFTEAIEKMYEYKISSNDFIGFAEYHYDEDDDEEMIELFTQALIAEIHKAYQARCESK